MMASERDLSEVLHAAGCSSWQTGRMIELASFLGSIPWGTASSASQEDGWGSLAFLEQLGVSDGLPAKSMIVADYSGRVSRWEVLGMLLIAESPAVKTLLPDPNLKAVTDLMESIVYEKLKEGFILMYGLPSRLRFWRLPKQKRLLVKLSRIYGMIYTCVQGMTIHTLIRPELVDRRNPFEPLFQVFERGVFPDWEAWQFTNMRLENLGRLPEPIL
jgi:hypothetical protein